MISNIAQILYIHIQHMSSASFLLLQSDQEEIKFEFKLLQDKIQNAFRLRSTSNYQIQDLYHSQEKPKITPPSHRYTKIRSMQLQKKKTPRKINFFSKQVLPVGLMKTYNKIIESNRQYKSIGFNVPSELQEKEKAKGAHVEFKEKKYKHKTIDNNEFCPTLKDFSFKQPFIRLIPREKRSILIINLLDKLRKQINS